MNNQFTVAPHVSGPTPIRAEAVNAALLIDFDNVTMGIRDNLAKELKKLLESDIIKGKVTVQRAYADWRRYPQYIVPLSEASIDLIFAPAYGSSKKNATDIRMAIDGIELVFIRPEIGTYILLTGDSDFSSLVLKLKEYGKYVIGVGIQESSSDILVQNCDEYYSYTSLTGLQKQEDIEHEPQDPWVLITDAARTMVERGDVMRSDRLKQVMVELDPTFDEKNFGFKKFSKFLSEAASRKLVKLERQPNGQFDVYPPDGGPTVERGGGDDGRKRRGSRSADQRERRGRKESPSENVEDPTSAELRDAYSLLRRALESMAAEGRSRPRDSDVKRRLRKLDPGFDEGVLGFRQFSHFLRQAHDHEVVDLEKLERGNYVVFLPNGGSGGNAGSAVAESSSSDRDAEEVVVQGRGRRVGGRATRPRRRGGAVAEVEELTPAEAAPVESMKPDQSEPERPRERRPERGERGRGERGNGGDRKGRGPRREKAEPQEREPERRVEADQAAKRAPPRQRPQNDATPSDSPKESSEAESQKEAAAEKSGRVPRRSLGARTGERRGRKRDDQPVRLLEGQVVPAKKSPNSGKRLASGRSDASSLDLQGLGLPTDPGAIGRYLTNRYKGVGEKTAEVLVEAFGSDVFTVLQNEPERVKTVVSEKRAEQVLENWKADYERRARASDSRE